MGQKRLNALAISIQREFIQRIPDINEKEIERLAHKKDRRATFLHNNGESRNMSCCCICDVICLGDRYTVAKKVTLSVSYVV